MAAHKFCLSALFGKIRSCRQRRISTSDKDTLVEKEKVLTCSPHREIIKSFADEEISPRYAYIRKG